MFWEMGAIMMTAGFTAGPIIVGAGALIYSAGKQLARAYMRRRRSPAAALAWVNGRKR